MCIRDSSWLVREGNSSDSPLLLDAEGRANPAYQAVVGAVG